MLGKELLTALAMEGKFSGEGLDGFQEDDDLITSMVSELLEEGEVGESAEAVWASLVCEGARLSTRIRSQEISRIATAARGNLIPGDRGYWKSRIDDHKFRIPALFIVGSRELQLRLVEASGQVTWGPRRKGRILPGRALPSFQNVASDRL